METITNNGKIIYTAKTHTTGGREHGVSQSSDGNLDVKLSTPGTGGTGTNPEQLLAAGWSACFEAAMATVARKKHLTLPEGTAIDTEVDLGMDSGGYYLQARLYASVPGFDKNVAQEVVDGASLICPYSKALKGNMKIEYLVV